MPFDLYPLIHDAVGDADVEAGVADEAVVEEEEGVEESTASGTDVSTAVSPLLSSLL